MPSFDIVSRVDLQEVDNAVNNTVKAIAQRYDFRGSETRITLDRKARTIHLLTEDKMKMQAIRELLQHNAVKRKVDLKALKFEDPVPAAGANVKADVQIREGLDTDVAKSIVKRIKDTRLKVQASIQGDEVRVSGKKIDDLQEVMSALRSADLDTPLQFVNLKS